MKQIISIIFGSLHLILFFIFGNILINSFQKTYEWFYVYTKENSKIIQGKIISKKEAIHYEIMFYDSLNNEHKFENSFYTNAIDRWQVGDKVELIYHSNDLKTIRINAYEEIIGLDLTSFFLIIIFFVALIKNVFIPNIYKIRWRRGN